MPRKGGKRPKPKSNPGPKPTGKVTGPKAAAISKLITKKTGPAKLEANIAGAKELHLVVTDGGQLAEPGEEGELVHCGPLVAQGYWQDAERTAERFKPAPAMSEYGGTAVWSGDRALRDADGLLHFVGRRDAMIKSAGNRISPQELEDAARATDLVSEAVALGVPDERLGQAVHLVVRGDAGRDADRGVLDPAARADAGRVGAIPTPTGRL